LEGRRDCDRWGGLDIREGGRTKRGKAKEEEE
jgi:hypothetical protein